MALMNLLIAIFIDELFKQTEKSDQKKSKAEIEIRKRKLEICSQAIMDFDLNGDGELQPSELKAAHLPTHTEMALTDNLTARPSWLFLTKTWHWPSALKTLECPSTCCRTRWI